MKLQTKIPLSKQSNNLIDYKSNILSIGSCFVENIGKKLDYYKFQNGQNPFGILFHPLAIETLITNAINKKEYTEDDIFFNNEQWHCFDAHSKLSNPSKGDLFKELNNQICSTNQQINNSTHIIITLGTAWQYRFIETDSVVANCHKIPQKQFLKELLSVDEIKESLQAIIALIRSVNKNASILFTVSPIRHLKDGFVENTQSKAHLIAAIHQVVEPRQQVFYFPSYEIMMDELRDYRFYKEDMIHPNQTAVNYIWEAFQNVWISPESLKIMEEVEAIQKGLTHKPFNPNSKAHKTFLQQLNQRQENLQLLFLHIQF
jgi:lysophospholipase L1-like esterase